jgi:hypothetical protein
MLVAERLEELGNIVRNSFGTEEAIVWSQSSAFPLSCPPTIRFYRRLSDSAHVDSCMRLFIGFCDAALNHGFSFLNLVGEEFTFGYWRGVEAKRIYPDGCHVNKELIEWCREQYRKDETCKSLKEMERLYEIDRENERFWEDYKDPEKRERLEKEMEERRKKRRLGLI